MIYSYRVFVNHLKTFFQTLHFTTSWEGMLVQENYYVESVDYVHDALSMRTTLDWYLIAYESHHVTYKTLPFAPSAISPLFCCMIYGCF